MGTSTQPRRSIFVWTLCKKVSSYVIAVRSFACFVASSSIGSSFYSRPKRQSAPRTWVRRPGAHRMPGSLTGLHGALARMRCALIRPRQ